MKRILVPCDFYEPSRQAFKFAIQLAERGGADVYVLKVNELPVMYEPGLGMPEYGFNAGLLTELEEDALNRLEAFKSQFAANVDRVHLLTEVGSVVSTIRDVIESRNIDVVVMGTHGEGTWLDNFVGTNTEKIVRSSRVPVFAIRKAVDVDSIRNIVLPGIVELNHKKVVDKLKDLQAFFGAKLHILYVNTPTSFRTDGDIRGAMQDFVKHYGLRDYTLNIFNEVSEEKGIISFMRHVKGDLIAMPTHGRRGLAHLFSHSLAEEVLSEAEWPLWTCVLEK
jgi:nucleotide-binding universal stress UspA family protein